MKNMKRLTSFLLSLLLILNVPLYAAAAVQPGEDISAAPDAASAGNYSIGGLLADTIEEAQTSSSQPCAVTEIRFDGVNAAVDYHADRDAVLAVAVYEEESGRMCSFDTVSAAAGGGTQTVAVSGEIPEHFIMKAFLIDPNTFEPLSESFTLNMYTQAMQELEESTTDDYDASHVINLDGNPANNFLVLDPSVVVLEDALQVSWDADNRTCTVSGNGADGFRLQSGDIIAWNGGEHLLVVRVASTSIADGVLTITAGEDLDAEEIFSVIKIDTDAKVSSGDVQQAATTSSDPVNKSEGSLSFTIQREIKPEYDGDVINGSLEGTVSGTLMIIASLKLYHIDDYTDFQLHIGDTFEGQFEVKGKGSVSLGLGQVLLWEPLPGVQFAFEPSLEMEFGGAYTAKVTVPLGFTFSINSETGMSCTEDETKPTFEHDLKGRAFFGFNLNPSVGVLWIDGSVVRQGLANAELYGKIGVDLETFSDRSTSTYHHDCFRCIEANVSFVAKMKGEIESSLKILQVKGELIALSLKLGSVYCTQYVEGAALEFGWGRCPHRSWRVNVTAMEEAFRTPSPNVVLAVDTLSDGSRVTQETCYTTDSKGQAAAYLPNGTHYFYGLCKGIYSEQKVVVDEKPLDAEILFNTGAEVTILTKAEDGTLLQGSVIEDTGLAENPVTDKNGEAHLILPEGTYTIYIENTKNSAKPYWWGPAEIEVRGKRAEINITMKPATFDYTFDGTTLTVTGSGPMPKLSFRYWSSMDTNESDAVSINIQGFTSVSEWAFNNFHKLQNVYISEGVRRIEDAAFIHATELTSVLLPSTLRKLGSAAGDDAERGVFENAHKLTQITLPHGLQELGGRAFRYSGLTSIDMPDTITVMGDSFIRCTDLTSVHISDGLAKLPTDAFIHCTGLTNVTLPKSLTYCAQAFLYCTNLEEICFTSEKQPEYVSYELVAGGGSADRVVTIKYPSTWEDPQAIISQFEGKSPETVWIPYEQ